MSHQPPPTERFAMLDGLRGIAALWVALFHIQGTGRLLDKALPAWLSALIGYGSLGVPVFFVLSGFAIAWSLRKVSLTPRSFGRFLLRRSIRLDPPYWATIACTVVLLSASNVLLPDRTVALPSWSLVLAHVFYLPDVLGLPKISEVFWTLFIEMQFYLFFSLLLASQQQLTRRVFPGAPQRVAAVLLGVSVLLSVGASIFPPADGNWHGVFVPHWYAYALGVAACFVVAGAMRPVSQWVMLAMVGMLVAVRQDAFSITAFLTAALIMVAALRGKMGSWLGGPAMQYLGRISYSLYLLHPLFGLRSSNLVFRLLGESEATALVAGAVALLASIVASHLMWWLVERPSIQLARRVALRADQA